MREMRISQETVAEVLGSAQVRSALNAERDRIAKRAQGIAESEQIPGKITAKDGVRPKGRPFARVEFDNADQEWGTARTARSRVLGRAAGR